MCVNPEEWAGEERRKYTPVEIRHWSPGTKVSAGTLAVLLVLNIVGSGMAYQKLVDSTTQNTEDISEVRQVDIGLMRSINDMTAATAGLRTSVDFLLGEIEDLEDEMREMRYQRDRERER
jgi:hypothetical protein